jgi:hypothetical protein
MKDQFGEFEERPSNFRNVDCSTHSVCRIEGDFLIYETESIHPKEGKDGRIPLMLLLGNPASHSVKEKMFFSYEKDGKEHRFWNVLEESGVFKLNGGPADLAARNRLRKEKLITATYESPFRIYLDVFYSIPSPASGKWSGVAGLKRLLGKRAFEEITKWEKDRIENLIKNCMIQNGVIITFQKDAYIQIRSKNSPKYNHKQAITKGINGQCRISPKVRLYCLAPTRLMHTNYQKLQKLKEQYAR